jgi:phosphate starvation-inducible PhoH-like protein
MEHYLMNQQKPKSDPLEGISIQRLIDPRSENQANYLESIYRNTFTFGIGLAGTGKTLLAAYAAVQALLEKRNKIDKIVIVRPVIGNKFGEQLGALPGTLLEKMVPYGSSVIDNMAMFLDKPAIEKLIYGGFIEFIPLTLLRGRSLNHSFVIVEEAQNIKQSANGVYMVMSRLGIHSKMVFNGDLRQSDLQDGDSALKAAIEKLRNPTMVKGVGIVELNDYRDVQRNPALVDIMERFGELEDDPF